VIALSCLAACAASEGQILTREDQPSVRDSVRSDMSLQYQLTGTVDTSVDAELFVIDLFDAERAQVAELHAAGRLVMAYVSVGSLENWRDDVSRFPRSAVGMSLANYPEESWLDPRDAQVRALMRARFERAVSKGFDGVFASTLGAYRANTGFPLGMSDELESARFLAETAHGLSLSIGLSGDFELADALAHQFDWAIAIGCVMRGTCADLTALKSHGVPVFDLETTGDHTRACQEAARYGVPVTFKSERYDAARSGCG
jgi:hypothetical protein